MDCRTGEIYDGEQMDAIRKMAEKQEAQAAAMKHFVPLTKELADELEPLGKRQRKNNMRNKPCVCGSGIKFKRCCWSKFA